MADELDSVPSLEDIQGMKVAELKKELKARGLTMSGNKTELIERLQEALDVPKDNSGSEDQIVSECLEGLENLDGTDEVNEDEVLSDDVLYSEEHKVNESQEINEEDILAPSSQAETVIPVKSAVKLHRKPLPILEETVQMDLEADSVKSSETKEEGENSENNVITDSEKKMVTTSTKTMTQEERLALRAKKFSNGIADKLKVRADRFGARVSKEENSVKPTAEKIISSPVDLTCLKKRAERFGQSVSSVMKQIDEKKKILKRKERFGASATTNSSEQIEEKTKILKTKGRFGTTEAADSSELELKKKRAERFNL